MTTPTKPHSARAVAAAASVPTAPAPLNAQIPDESEEPGMAGRIRAPRISREEVFATADALLLEGIRPTIDRVRVKLGRGSPNTINEFMDAWWLKLGSRLRDLPGQEFPQLPERVATNLRKLWNDALDAAHEVLRDTLAQREAQLVERERTVEADRQGLERERLSQAARGTALEEALNSERKQLEEANQRARGLEHAFAQRGIELQEARSERDRHASELAAERTRREAEQKDAVAERARLQERYDSSEGRWLTELDRARQALKSSEAGVLELRGRLSKLTEERDSAKTQIMQLRGELATASAVREQLEARLKLNAPRPQAAQSPKRSRTKLKRSVQRAR